MVTSPTQTEAIYSLAPPPNRHGVIAVLVRVYSGATPNAALQMDADELFDQLGLFDHLSPTRHVGVYAIVERMRTVARELGGTEI